MDGYAFLWFAGLIGLIIAGLIGFYSQHSAPQYKDNVIKVKFPRSRK